MYTCVTISLYKAIPGYHAIPRGPTAWPPPLYVHIWPLKLPRGRTHKLGYSFFVYLRIRALGPRPSHMQTWPPPPKGAPCPYTLSWPRPRAGGGGGGARCFCSTSMSLTVIFALLDVETIYTFAKWASAGATLIQRGGRERGFFL